MKMPKHLILYRFYQKHKSEFFLYQVNGHKILYLFKFKRYFLHHIFKM